MIAMIKKEIKEIFISYKVFFIPIAFALVAMVTPVSIKMMPELLKNTSELPEGSIIQIADPKLSDMLISFFNGDMTLIVIIIALILMGSIAGERASGVASLVLVKPISTTKYYMSKLLVSTGFILISYILGHGIALYYTNLLAEGLVFMNAVKGLLYILPLIFLLVTITLFYSSFMKSQLGAAGLSLLTSFILLNVPQYINKSFAKFSPNQIILNGSSLLNGTTSNEYIYPIILALILALAFSIGSCFILRKQEF